MIEVGQTLGAYEITARLKSGGMANLFLGTRRGPAGFTRHVVIKAVKRHLAAHDSFVKMFIDEARIAARIHHPHVVKIEELGEDDGTYFLVMEHVLGVALSELLASLAEASRRLVPEVSVRILSAICSGLHAAHETPDENGQLLGVIHRDVSPQNVLLGVGGDMKLIDFGIAKARDRLHVTAAGSGLKGKLRYMAPEQLLRSDIDRRADVYSLGVLAWEMLTMRRLFQGKSDVEVMTRIREGNFAPPGAFASIPHALDSAIMSALASNLDERPASAEIFRQQLRQALPQASTVDHAQLGGLLWAVRRPILDERAQRLGQGAKCPFTDDQLKDIYNRYTEPVDDEFADSSTLPAASMAPRFSVSDAIFSAPEYVAEAEDGAIAVATLYEVLDEDERTKLRALTKPAQFGTASREVSLAPPPPPPRRTPQATTPAAFVPRPPAPASPAMAPLPAPAAVPPPVPQSPAPMRMSGAMLAGVALLGLLAGAVLVLAALLLLS
ncbi:MAG: serine/threonine protein kinase [Polyangiales bacterium]